MPDERGRLAPGTPKEAGFEVRLPGPLDAPASLEVFRRSGDDLMDRWDRRTLIRTIRAGKVAVSYACTPTGTVDEPTLRVAVEDPSWGREAERAARSSFLWAPPECADLLRRDPVIAGLNELYPGLRQPRQFDLLAALVRCISAQQVNLRWAATTRRRLAEAFGEEHRVNGRVVRALDAERLAADPAEIQALQFTTRKAEYIVGAAQAVAGGRLKLADLAALPDDEAIRRLTSLRGVGPWTAEWMLTRALGRPRVVAGDLAVRKAVSLAYSAGRSPLPNERETRAATSHWGPSSGVAQALLLHALAEGTLPIFPPGEQRSG